MSDQSKSGEFFFGMVDAKWECHIDAWCPECLAMGGHHKKTLYDMTYAYRCHRCGHVEFMTERKYDKYGAR